MSNRAFEVNEMIVGMGFAAEFMLFVIAALATPYLWSGFRRVSTSKKYEGRAYMASLFHSIWATGVSMYLMWTVRNDNREMMYRGLYSVDGELLSFACGTICGHLVTDALYSIIFSKAMDEYNMFWQMMFHHVLFLFAIYGNFYYCVFLPMFWNIYIGELSSIFLACRWFMIRGGNTKSFMFTAMNVLFGFTFFLTRVLLLSYSVFQIFMEWKHVRESSPMMQQLSILVLLPFACVLNLYWFVSFSIKTCSGGRGDGEKKEK